VSQTRVQFIEGDQGNHVVVVVHTTIRGGLVAHLVDTCSRIRVELHKVESRLDDEGWVQKLVVAAPAGEKLSRGLLDDLKAAVFATIQTVSLNIEDESASGTFAVAPASLSGIEETG